MRRIYGLLLVGLMVLTGCNNKETTMIFERPEQNTITFAPVNEKQHLTAFTQVNITELEGLKGITEADILLPVPSDAVWDANTGTYSLPDNFINENGESFVMTISLEPISDEMNYSTIAYTGKKEVDELKELNAMKYGGSYCDADDKVVVKCIKETVMEESVANDESTKLPKKTVTLDIDAYDFKEPTYHLQVKIEIVKAMGTVDDTEKAYASAMYQATMKFKYHYQRK